MGDFHQNDDDTPQRYDAEEGVIPIAIIGIGCRYPGGATDPEKLWEVLSTQQGVWTPVPKERFDQDAYYHPDTARCGTSNVRGAHFLNEHPGLFDAHFFNLTQAEADAMDPQQRIMLECSYEALENAGIPMDCITGTDTGVFMGSSCRDYTDLLLEDPQKTELYQATGTGATMLANRISYFYDLKGPSLTVDTACSSSLVALHLACTSLRLGESKTAIVGGSNLILGPAAMISLSMLRFLSPDGRCYTFDSRGNGFGRGEGAACLVLKPLSAALENGNTIRAVIRNSGTNQDGRTSGITLPSGKAQVQLIERLYASAGLDPKETTYVEAHGTGTTAGDPIEAASLARVFCKGREEGDMLRVGSVKSNIGHLEGGSGIAGVVKTVLMLERGEILPNFDFREANMRIPLNEWKIKVPTFVMPWDVAGVRRASVNNFGFGGSNAHVILDDSHKYMAYCPEFSSKIPANGSQDDSSYLEKRTKRTRLFPLSAFNEEAGKRLLKTVSEYLETHAKIASETFLADLAFTLGQRRSLLPWRAAVSATSRVELLDKFGTGEVTFSKIPRSSNIGFVFTGQGAQWAGMGKELIASYPIFSESMRNSGEYLAKLGADWSLTDELQREQSASRIGTALISQPLCTALQIALVDLLISWNVKPASVTGHSSGEIAAAYAAGVLTQESALTIAYFRGVVSSQVKDVKGLKPGAMMAVGLSSAETQVLISDLKEGRVNVACVNSTSSVTVSGDATAIDALEEVVKAKGAFVRKLAVDTAYHSHHMQHVAEKYLQALTGIQTINSAEVEFFSSVTGNRIESSELGAKYWVKNLVSPVLFSDSVRNMCLTTGGKRKGRRRTEVTIDALIEIGPHSALSGPIKQILQADPKLASASIEYLSILSRSKDAVETSLNLAASLFKRGVPLTMQAVNNPVHSPDHKVLVDLPPYPWNHSTLYWASSLGRLGHPRLGFPRSDILGLPVRPVDPTNLRWRNILRTSDIPWIQDHKIQSNIICPAAHFLAMAIEGAHQESVIKDVQPTGYKLREVTIGHALVISQADDVETVLSLKSYGESNRLPSDTWNEFCITSSTDGKVWTVHCRGLISINSRTEVKGIDGGQNAKEEKDEYLKMIAEFNEVCTSTTDRDELYDSLSKLGLDFGPTFANMHKARASHDKCIANITIPETASVMPAKFQYPFVVHPTTLDSFFHAIFPVGNGHKNMDQGTPVPTFIDEMFISSDMSRDSGHEFLVYTKVDRKDLGNNASKGLAQTLNDLTIFDPEREAGVPVATVSGLRFSSLPRSDDSKDQVEKIAHQIKWHTDSHFLDENQLKELTARFRQDPENRRQSRMIQQAAFYYAECALEEVKLSQIDPETPHLKNLYTVLSHFCHNVHDGKLGVHDTSGWISASPKEKAALCEAVSETSYEILCHIGENLPQILRNEVNPLSLMMEDDRLERHYRTNQVLAQCYSQAAVYASILANKNPFLNILEIGAGTGGATFPILDALTSNDGRDAKFATYDFTDISTGFFEKVSERIKIFGDLVTFKRLDIESDPEEQGFESGSYDLVIAANVLHATKSIKNTLKRVRSLLKPGGSLILIEITVSNLAASLIFGTLPGWWAGEETNRQMGPLLTEPEWDDALSKADFDGLKATLWDTPDDENHHSSTMISTARVHSSPQLPSKVTIIMSANTEVALVHSLEAHLNDLGIESRTSNLTDYIPDNSICIVLEELQQSVLRNPNAAKFEALKSNFLRSAGVLWVTRGAMLESNSPDSSLVTGMTRTIRTEKGDTMLVNLDLGLEKTHSADQDARAIVSIWKNNFYVGSAENIDLDVEYAVRDETILIPRVVEDADLTNLVVTSLGKSVPEEQPFFQEIRYLRAEIKTPGFLDSLQFVDDERISGDLQDDHVQIDVKAAGLNFRDVMSASGQIDPYPLGCECSGVVTAVGKFVTDFSVGDHVIANVLGGCFCNTVRAPAVSVEKVPHDMPFEVAASLPIAYLTAYYAVMKIARVGRGETVLVHAAAGGLGQAIINLCLLVGAEIFATVGTLEKKELLMQHFDIVEDHIFSSRDDTFAKGILRRTKGRGVDVIMNSTSGDMLRQTWNCIAPFGRFVELGKRDMTVNTRLEMQHFERNVSFTGLDVPLHTHFEEKRRIWQELMQMYQRGEIAAVHPITTYGISELEKALRIMQTGKHTGKLVVVPQEDETVKVLPRNINHQLLRGDASYLLIGGLGGIGRAIAGWMIDWGARHLIFMSPSGLDKEKSREFVNTLKARGANVLVSKGDVANMEDVEIMLKECADTMPPIRGMVHAAMVPKADLFENLTLEDYQDTIKAKVDGTWNLHNSLPKASTDFFILLSSQVGALGNASQAAYAAANVFLDNFASMRNVQGLPAVSLGLGRVVGVGFVAENEGAQRGLNKLWSRDIEPEELKALIKSAIVTPLRKGQPGSSITGMKPWAPEASPIYLAPMFSHYRRAALTASSTESSKGASGEQLRELLRDAISLDDAVKHVYQAVISKMAVLLMIPAEDISETKSMAEYGMDSLVAVEMRNWLIRECDCTMPILELLANVGLRELSGRILRKSKLASRFFADGVKE
ncbi:putative polyketide synthase [Cadophora sp. MPI-SDFR-AT-0126]|nr:putative polyketide synthase [Leotiomycetes sp. MPI-SDFR-AT-0126]